MKPAELAGAAGVLREVLTRMEEHTADLDGRDVFSLGCPICDGALPVTQYQHSLGCRARQALRALEEACAVVEGDGLPLHRGHPARVEAREVAAEAPAPAPAPPAAPTKTAAVALRQADALAQTLEAVQAECMCRRAHVEARAVELHLQELHGAIVTLGELVAQAKARAREPQP